MKRIHFFLYALLIALVFSISAQAWQGSMIEPASVASTEGVPSSIIGGHVSAITGEFTDSQTDIVIQGPEPLVLQRVYSSGNNSINYLGHAWSLNHPQGMLMDWFQGYTINTFTALIGEPSGGIFKYMVEIPNTLKNPIVQLPIDKINGFTNCGSGSIGARSNIKNQQVTCNLSIKDTNCQVLSPSGDLRYFKPSPVQNTGDKILFDLQWEKKANGHLLLYAYSSIKALSSIRAANHDLTAIYGSINFTDITLDDLLRNPRMLINTSDGRTLTYNLMRIKASKDDKKNGYNDVYYLKDVINSSRPQEKYTYAKKVGSIYQQLTRKEWPRDRFIEAEYYHVGINTIGNISDFNLCPKGDQRLNRVKLLKAPVGSGSTPVVTHQFVYNLKMHPKKKTEIVSGTTEVYNAYNHCTIYHFVRNRLSIIEKCKGSFGNSQKYSQEKFVWGADDTATEGYLIGKSFVDAQGKVLTAHAFTYDERGNIIHDKLYGNLTGKGNSPVLGPNGLPIENGCESYPRSFAYRKDSTNAIEVENEGNGRGIIYQYKPSTDLISAKYIYSGNNLCQRQYYDYDSHGCVIKSSMDDGVTNDKNNSAGVTERLITHYINSSNAPIGLPIVQGEHYLDVATGQERLIRNTFSTYSLDGHLLNQKVCDANGQELCTRSWVYNTHGKVIAETDPLGQITTRHYDDNDNLVFEQVNRHDWHKEYEYDFSNRLVCAREVFSDGVVIAKTHRYNLLSQPTATIDSFGNEINYVYDELGRIVQTIGIAVQDENGQLIQPTTSFEYDIANNPIIVTDPKGRVTRSTYNAYGKPLSIIYPDGTSEQFEYNLDGTLKKTVAKNGLQTVYEHDVFGRLLKKEEFSPDHQLLSSNTSVYNSFHLLSTTDPEGCTTSYSYGPDGHVSTVVKGESKITLEYDALGRVIKTFEWLDSNATEAIVKINVYDVLNRVIEERIENITGQIQKKTNFRYDVDNNQTDIITETSAGTSVTHIDFDARKKPIQMIDPEGNITHYSYNYAFRNKYNQNVLQTTVTDALGNSVVTTMDAANRLQSVVRLNAMGIVLSQREILYDSIGNQAKTIDAVIAGGSTIRNVVTVWQYNSMNQLIRLIEAVDTPEQKETIVRYNVYGQKDTIVRPDGILVHHEYDGKGRLQVFRASDNSFAYSYEYDRIDKILKVIDLNRNTSTIRCYDDFGRLITEALDTQVKVKYSYDRSGRVTNFILPDGSGIEYVYDASLLKKAIRKSTSQEPLYSHSYDQYDNGGTLLSARLIGEAGSIEYAYDNIGRMRQITAPHWSENIPEGGYDVVSNLRIININDSNGAQNSSYDYDDLYQLASESGHVSHHYVNDSLNNRIQKDDHEYTVNALNQLLNESEFQYVYDKNGNLICKDDASGQKINYSYDALDRLIAVTKGAERFEYIYDSFNRRISKLRFESDGNDDWKQISSENYLYQGQNEIGIVDDAGNVVEFRLLALGKGAEIGAAVAIELEGNVYSPIHDHNGNVVAIIDYKSGNCEEFYRYSAFGEETVFDNAGTEIDGLSCICPWRFSSKRVDPETGFIYFGRRYYEPRTGRWVAPDPLGFQAGPNLYAYVMNSPLNHFDLYGLYEKSEVSFLQNSFDKTRDFLGNSLINVSRNLPGHHLRLFGEQCGSLIKEGTVSYDRDFYETGCKDTSWGSGSLPNGDRISFYSGMYCTLEQCTEYVTRLSKMCGGKIVYGYHTPTRGFCNDFGGCVAWAFGVPDVHKTEVSYVRNELMKQYLETKGEARLLQMPHSRATQILDNALDTLPQCVRDKIYITTFGAAHPIAPHKAKYVWNYISNSDPLYVAIPDYAKRTHDNITVLKSDRFFQNEHSFGEKIYQDQAQIIINDFIHHKGPFKD